MVRWYEGGRVKGYARRVSDAATTVMVIMEEQDARPCPWSRDGDAGGARFSNIPSYTGRSIYLRT